MIRLIFVHAILLLLALYLLSCNKTKQSGSTSTASMQSVSTGGEVVYPDEWPDPEIVVPPGSVMPTNEFIIRKYGDGSKKEFINSGDMKAYTWQIAYENEQGFDYCKKHLEDILQTKGFYHGPVEHTSDTKPIYVSNDFKIMMLFHQDRGAFVISITVWNVEIPALKSKKLKPL